MTASKNPSFSLSHYAFQVFRAIWQQPGTVRISTEGQTLVRARSFSVGYAASGSNFGSLSLHRRLHELQGRIFRMDKIAMLTEILEQNPADAFARYGLAMEHASLGHTDIALNEFDRLLHQHPEYTAGYFMCAQTLLKANRIGEAKKRLQEGIDSAQKTGNDHARGEMQAVLDDLS